MASLPTLTAMIMMTAAVLDFVLVKINIRSSTLSSLLAVRTVHGAAVVRTFIIASTAAATTTTAALWAIG